MRNQNQAGAGPSGWATAALVLGACCLVVLPAAAEGGSYPSLGVLVGIGLGYLLLIPLAATVLAYGTMKLLRPQKAVRWKRAFAVALATWVALMLTFNYSGLDHYLSDSAAMAGGGLLVFGGAFCTAFFARAANPPPTI